MRQRTSVSIDLPQNFSVMYESLLFKITYKLMCMSGTQSVTKKDLHHKNHLHQTQGHSCYVARFPERQYCEIMESFSVRFLQKLLNPTIILPEES